MAIAELWRQQIKGWWSRQPFYKLPQPKVIEQFGPAIVRLATHRINQQAIPASIAR
jgi:hypothetical protein